jgi:hypothetical protein
VNEFEKKKEIEGNKEKKEVMDMGTSYFTCSSFLGSIPDVADSPPSKTS